MQQSRTRSSDRRPPNPLILPNLVVSSGSFSQTHSAQGFPTSVSAITGGSCLYQAPAKPDLTLYISIMQDSHTVSSLKRQLYPNESRWCGKGHRSSAYDMLPTSIQVTRIFSGGLGRTGTLAPLRPYTTLIVGGWPWNSRLSLALRIRKRQLCFC
jgi:hypothetical protein